MSDGDIERHVRPPSRRVTSAQGAVGARHEQALDLMVPGERPIEPLLAELKIARASGSSAVTAQYLCGIGTILRGRGELRRAMSYFNRALTLLSSHHPTPELARVLYEIGRLQSRDCCDFASAASTFRRAADIASACRDTVLHAEALCCEADDLTVVGDLVTARARLATALSWAERIDCAAIVGHAYMGIGLTYGRRGLYREGQEFYHKALVIAEDLSLTFPQAISLGNIANTYIDQGDFDAAQEYYGRAFAILDPMGPSLFRDHYRAGYAEMLTRRGEPEVALEVLREGMMRSERRKEYRCLGASYAAAGRAYLAMNDRPRAFAAANDALRFATGIRDGLMTAGIYRLLACIAEDGWMANFSVSSPLPDSRRQQQVEGPVDREVEIQSPDRVSVARRHRGSSSEQIATLKAELERRSLQLLMAGLQAARQNQRVIQLRHRIDSLAGQSDEGETVRQELLSVIGREAVPDDPAPSLDRQLHEMNDPFLHRLYARCSELTATELKICTLLRANLSSKEISEMLTVSVHTVDTHRQRIRRKLSLSRDVNLQAYLAAIC